MILRNQPVKGVVLASLMSWVSFKNNDANDSKGNKSLSPSRGTMTQEQLNNLRIADKAPRKRQKRPWLWALALMTLLTTGAILYRQGIFALPIEVETVTVGRMYPAQGVTQLNASGYVVAQRKAAVASKTTGRLEWLGVLEGDRVKAGQILARLENEDSAAAQTQARAALALAEARQAQAQVELADGERSFRRLEKLCQLGAVAQAELETAEARRDTGKAAMATAAADIEVARAALATAGITLDYSLIRAPFDAVVLTKNADIGDIITPIGAAANAKAAVVTIADLGSLQVEADVAESNLGRVHSGQPCEIMLDALPDLRLKGELKTIVPTADRGKASVLVKVAFLEKDARILPEMSAKVAFLERELTPAEKAPRLVLPPQAIVEQNGGRLVFVVEGGLAVARAVTLADPLGDMIEVTAGVTPGDRVIVKPLTKIRPGVKVKAAESR